MKTNLRFLRAGLLLLALVSVTRAQVYECLAYYEDHRGEIDWRIAEQMAEGTLTAR
jgi:hypothetical protein